MKTIVLTAALLAAFTMPALAEEIAPKIDGNAPMTKVDPVTTGSTNQSQIESTTAKSDYSGCMRRKSASLEMM